MDRTTTEHSERNATAAQQPSSTPAECDCWPPASGLMPSAAAIASQREAADLLSLVPSLAGLDAEPAASAPPDDGSFWPGALVQLVADAAFPDGVAADVLRPGVDSLLERLLIPEHAHKAIAKRLSVDLPTYRRLLADPDMRVAVIEAANRVAIWQDFAAPAVYSDAGAAIKLAPPPIGMFDLPPKSLADMSIGELREHWQKHKERLAVDADKLRKLRQQGRAWLTAEWQSTTLPSGHSGERADVLIKLVIRELSQSRGGKARLAPHAPALSWSAWAAVLECNTLQS